MSAFLAVTLLSLFAATFGQEVEAPVGKIKGSTVEVDDGKAKAKVRVFLGVPYAEPPVGPLRFKPPQKKEKIADVYDATKQPKLCVQVNPKNFEKTAKEQAKAKGMDPMAQQKELEKEIEGIKITGGALVLGKEFAKLEESARLGDEDCLYMNIYAPESKTKLPVAVYFHGGIFYAGGITIPSFDGSILAARGKLIVIAVQYRLSVYGFLHGAVKDIPGNMGLQDQAQSLRWIQENIEAFSGDKDRVTIMGSNSGGWSVGFHLMSPMSEGLFKRAIMQSGSLLAPLMMFGEPAARARFERFVTTAKCPLGAKASEKDAFSPVTDETVKCLTSKTRQEIDEIQAATLSAKKDIGFVPSEDNTKDICFFCTNPFDFVKDGTFKLKGEVLLGTNSNEGGVFLSSGLKEIYPPFKGEPQPKDLNQLVEYAKSFGQNQNAGQLQMMLPMFFRGVDKKNPVAVRNRLLELIADGLFVCPDQQLVGALAKKVPTYYYRFDYRPSKTYWNKWLEGAMHMDEHQFIWGIPFREDAKDNYDDNDRKMSELMISIWAKFITDGTPAVQKKWKWKPNKGKDRAWALINSKGVKGQKSFPKNSCKDLIRYYSMGRSFLKNYKP